ncbi:DNA polymerase delta catalytic subunit, partial [Irineochytrium annulatum]
MLATDKEPKRKMDQENHDPDPAKSMLKKQKSGGGGGGAKGSQSNALQAVEGMLSFEARLLAMHEEDVKVKDYEATWPRNAVVDMDDALVFQQIDIEDYVGPAVNGLNPYELKDVPILRMFGVTENGASILCHVHGFLPYFYVPAPNGFKEEHIEHFRQSLNVGLRSMLLMQKGRKDQTGVSVISVQIVYKQNIFGFNGHQKNIFLQIFLHYQNQVSTAKKILEDGININPIGVKCFTTFESNIAFTLRFMIDTKIVGMNWIEVAKGKFIQRMPQKLTSFCQYEFDVHYNDLISHTPDDTWSKIAPLRVLSFDIECCGRKGFFPDASQDAVIQIANMVTRQGESKPFIRNVFTLKQCANIVGTHTLSFDTEEEMLKKWCEFIQKVTNKAIYHQSESAYVEQADPDIITGYNTTNFDFPYLLERAIALRLNGFPYLGRCKGIQTKAKDTRLSSKALGTRDNKTTNLEGRLQMDVLQIMQRDYKLRSYTLNSVSAHFL